MLRIGQGGVVVAWLLMGACAAPSGEPAWAMDTLRLEPGGEAIVGVQTWALFDEAWADGQRGTRQICTVLVGLSGEPTAQGCEACEVRWRVATELIEHDCPRGVVRGLPVLTELDGVGVGAVDAALAEDAPFDGVVGAWARYGGRWVPFGWGWPAGADVGEAAAGPWDGEASFDLWPAFAWSLANSDIGVAVDADDRWRPSEIEAP